MPLSRRTEDPSLTLISPPLRSGSDDGAGTRRKGVDDTGKHRESEDPLAKKTIDACHLSCYIRPSDVMNQKKAMG